MPALPSISTPTEFSLWKTGPQFAEVPASARVDLFDGAAAGIRCARAQSAEGFWFYVSMTSDEEIEFQAIYFEWQVRWGLTGGTTATINPKPPTCGTENTPPCPMVDDEPGGLFSVASSDGADGPSSGTSSRTRAA